MAKKEKTVGEILEEEYAKQLGKEKIEEVKPKEEVKEPKIKFEQEIDLRQVVMNIEKLGAEVNALKEIRFHADERIKELAESIGELRSLLFQRDATIKETEAKTEKLEEIVSEIKPEKISAQLKKREAEIAEVEARIEKLERMSQDLLNQIKKSQKILESIKSMENLMEISKEIGSKLDKIEELKAGVERDAGKTERIFFEMDKRLAEFSAIKEKIDKLDDLTKELVRGLDEQKIKLDTMASKEDLQKALETALKPPPITEKIEELSKRKEELVNLLKHLEEQFKQGIISERSYLEIVEKNRGILKQIEDEIKQAETKKRPESLISWLEEVEDKIKGLNAKLEIQEERETNISKGIEELKDEISKIKDGLERQKAMLTDVLGLQITQEGLLEESKIKALEMEAQSIKSLLESLEEQYKEKTISEETYKETKEKGLARLKEIESQMKSETVKPSGISIFDRIKEVEKKFSEIPQTISELKSEMEKTKLEISKKVEEDLEEMKKTESRNYEELNKKLLDLSALTNKIANLELLVNELIKFSEEYRTKISSFESILPKATEIRAELKDLVVKREEELKALMEDKINALKSGIVESLEKMNEIRMEIEKRFSEIPEFLEKIRKADSRINETESKVREWIKKKEEEYSSLLERRMSEFKETISQLKNAIEVNKRELFERLEKIDFENILSKINKVESEYEKMKEKIESFDAIKKTELDKVFAKIHQMESEIGKNKEEFKSLVEENIKKIGMDFAKSLEEIEKSDIERISETKTEIESKLNEVKKSISQLEDALEENKKKLVEEVKIIDLEKVFSHIEERMKEVKIISESLKKVKEVDLTNILKKIDTVEAETKNLLIKREEEATKIQELKSLIEIIKSEIEKRIEAIEANVNSLKKLAQEFERRPYILE